MSGFERILARVGGDALRDYCSSAIEDELRSLKGKMEGCVAAVEQALQVQDAILKLDVPLDDSAAAFRALQKDFKRFHADLDAFVAEQNRVRSLAGRRLLLLYRELSGRRVLRSRRRAAPRPRRRRLTSPESRRSSR